MTRTRTRVFAIAAVAVAMLGLAACGDDSDEATAGTAPQTEENQTEETPQTEEDQTDETPTEDETGAAANAGSVPDACTLVEAAEVTDLIGAAEPEGETDTAIDGLDYSQCNWENDDGLFIISVIGGSQRYEMHTENLPGEPLEGVGEEAITAPGVSSETKGATGGRTISALVDGKTLVVALKVPGKTSVDMVAPIATTVAERLAA